MEDKTNTMNIPIREIELNNGQIAGLPKNPRFIRDDRFNALVKSIADAPEMLQLRELIVVRHGMKYIVIGGNMRLRACKELKFKDVPCKVLPEDTPVEKLREYVIKDNNAFGDNDWDSIANEWDVDELTEWGMELPSGFGDEEEEPTDLDEDMESKAFALKITFKSADKLQEFLFKYESLIKDEFDCIISMSGGGL